MQIPIVPENKVTSDKEKQCNAVMELVICTLLSRLFVCYCLASLHVIVSPLCMLLSHLFACYCLVSLYVIVSPLSYSEKLHRRKFCNSFKIKDFVVKISQFHSKSTLYLLGKNIVKSENSRIWPNHKNCKLKNSQNIPTIQYIIVHTLR